MFPTNDMMWDGIYQTGIKSAVYQVNKAKISKTILGLFLHAKYIRNGYKTQNQEYLRSYDYL